LWVVQSIRIYVLAGQKIRYHKIYEYK